MNWLGWWLSNPEVSRYFAREIDPSYVAFRFENHRLKVSDWRIHVIITECISIINRGVADWNRWRTDNPEIIPDLSGADLAERDLEGVNFSGTVLSGANLNSAILRHANLNGVTAYRTSFFAACLDDALLLSAKCNGAVFTRASAIRTNLTSADLRKALIGHHHRNGGDSISASSPDHNATFAKAILIHAVLDKANLNGASFQHSIFTNASLRGATLIGADLSETILRDTKLVGAVLRNASLRGASLRNTDIRSADLRYANLETTRDLPTVVWNLRTRFGNNGINAAAWQSGMRLQLQRHITDQEYICELEEHPGLYERITIQLWKWSCYFGQSVALWSMWCFLLILFFGIVYDCNRHWFKQENEMGAVSPYYLSVVTFTTLGFGDLTPRGHMWVAQVCLILEVIIGYVMLGGLLSIFSNRLARRA